MTPLPIHVVFGEALDLLESSGLPFAIMGGFAVRALGLPRPTYDGDVVVDADADRSLLLDIEELLKIHRLPDLAYLRQWAGRLGLSRELEDQLRSAEL